MSDYDLMQTSQQNSPAMNSRNLISESQPSVPPPPAYPGLSNPAAGAGLLRTKISLGGRKPAVIMPFTLMKPELPAPSPINGSMNLLTYYGLDHALSKFCAPNRKMKEELSAFLPHLPGNIDTPGNQDNSSLRSLIDKPPICGKEILPLSTSALSGFKLQPGSIPEQYRVFAGTYGASRSIGEEKSDRHSKKKHKRKHERSRGSEDRPLDTVMRPDKSLGLGTSGLAIGGTIGGGATIVGDQSQSGGGGQPASTSGDVAVATADEGRKVKTEESGGGGGGEKKKKKKKDKKRKRSRSPDHASSSGANPPSASTYSTADFVDF